MSKANYFYGLVEKLINFVQNLVAIVVEVALVLPDPGGDLRVSATCIHNTGVFRVIHGSLPSRYRQDGGYRRLENGEKSFLRTGVGVPPLRHSLAYWVL